MIQIIGCNLIKKFSSMLAHKIAAKDAMQQHHYSKAVMHWRYVYDHLENSHPDKDLIKQSIAQLKV